MDFRSNTSKLINDIMADDNSVVLLYAESGYGKTEFLTDLSNNYKNVYWLNSITDDVELFGLCLAEKVFSGEPQKMLQIKQLVYCESPYNSDRTILSVVLEYISQIKESCLIVFERMELLSPRFDRGLIEVLIKNCPKNLKIILSSNEFYNLNYASFDDKKPKLIDGAALSAIKRTDDEILELLDRLSDRDLSFLYYICEIDYMHEEYINLIYPEGIELFGMLQAKSYVVVRDPEVYRFTGRFVNVLKRERDENKRKLPLFNEVNALERALESLWTHQHYFTAFKVYNRIGDIKMADECIKKLRLQPFEKIRLFSFAKQNGSFLTKEHCIEAKDFIKKYFHDIQEAEKDDYQSYPFYKLYVALCLESRGEYEKAYSFACDLTEKFQKEDLQKFYYDAWQIAIKNQANMGDKSAALNTLLSLLDKYLLEKGDSTYYREITNILCMATVLHRDVDKGLNLKILKEFDSHLHEGIVGSEIWYIKCLLHVSEAYMISGNYNRGIKILAEIRKMIPQFVIPYNFMFFYYYAGEFKKAEKEVDDALAFADKYEINTDKSLLYITKAYADASCGRVKEALLYTDKAIMLERGLNYTRFFNIAHRCILCAKYGDPKRAKEIALIALSSCEKNMPGCSNMIYGALAFCYDKLKMGQECYTYALKCSSQSRSRTDFWLLSMVFATNYFIDKGDYKNVPSFIQRILYSAANHGMETVLVDNMDVCRKFFNYAKINNIEADYVKKLESLFEAREVYSDREVSIRIRFFGTTTILVNDKEVLWKTRKAKELFLHYVLAGKNGIDRGVIIDNLWKDYVYESAINNLKTTNNIIRKILTECSAKFKLDYLNSKYILNIDGLSTDFEEYTKLFADFENEKDALKKIELMNGLIEKYQDGFAVEITSGELAETRKKLQQELVLEIIRLSSELFRQREFVEAKRLLVYGASFDKQGFYKKTIEELISRIEN